MEHRALLVASGAVALALLATSALALRTAGPLSAGPSSSRGKARAALPMDDAGCFEASKGSKGVQTAADEACARAIRRARESDPTIRQAAQRGVSFRRQEIEYEACEARFRGFAMVPEGGPAPARLLPGVLLVPTAVGVHDDFVAFTAERMAALGCVVLVVGAPLPQCTASPPLPRCITTRTTQAARSTHRVAGHPFHCFSCARACRPGGPLRPRRGSEGMAACQRVDGA